MNWLQRQIGDINQVNEIITAEFSQLDVALMDFKPDANSWSINECFDHLIQSNKLYHAIFDAIANRRYAPRRGVPILSRLAGQMLLKVVSPEYKGKFKTSPLLYPLQSTYKTNLATDLVKANEVLTGYFEICEEDNLDSLIVVSPVNKWVTYSLRECITLLVKHERRHLNQALNLKRLVQHDN